MVEKLLKCSANGWKLFKQLGNFASAVVMLLALDQALKFLSLNSQDFSIPNPLSSLIRFECVKNRGFAFGCFDSVDPWIKVLGSCLACAYLTYFVVKGRLAKSKKKGDSFPLSMLTAGLFSNGIDRIIRNYVVDYIVIVPLVREGFPIFNLADFYIVAALCSMVFIPFFNTLVVKNKA